MIFLLKNRAQVVYNARFLNRIGAAQVKCHSLYVLEGTKLGEMYKKGDISMLECTDFITRTILFLRNLDKNIIVQRLMGRAPSPLLFL